jgi:hypothetical protein
MVVATVAAGRRLAGSGRVAQSMQQARKPAWLGEGIEDRLGVTCPGQVKQATGTQGSQGHVVIPRGQIAEQASHHLAKQLATTVG